MVENFQVELSAYLYGNGTGATWYPGSSTSVSTTGYGTIEIDSWRNYDLINVSATLGGYGITSVAARLIDNTSEMEIVIPFEMNYINLSNYQGQHENTLLTISCDMRGVDPASAPDSTLIISINTSVPDGHYGYIQPTSIYGSILVESPDEYLPWLKNIFLTLSAIDSSSYHSQLLISDLFSYLRTEFKTFLSNSFDSVVHSLDLNFSSLDSRLESFFKFDKTKPFDPDKTNPLWSYFGEFFLLNTDLLKGLNQGTPVDPSVSQGMTSAGQELADLGQAMAAGTPQVNTQVQVSVPDIPDDGSGILATTMFNFFWQQDYILKMLLTVVALATISYIFFGKKG